MAPEQVEPDARLWLRALVGSVWRLTWTGDTPGGERTAALSRFTTHLQALFALGGADRELALLGSAWVTLALDDDPLGTAWQIDDLLAEPVGPHLRRVLDFRGDGAALLAYWKPLRFAAARAKLAELVQVQPNFRANPAPELFGEAREDAQALLRAAESEEHVPKVRLLGADVETWASEARGTHQLLRGVKVWNTLVEWMRRLQDAAVELKATWAPGVALSTPPKGIEGWADGFVDTELAAAFLHDLRLSKRRRPLPTVLQPRSGLAALESCVADLDVHDRVELLFLVDEIRGDTGLADPSWAVDARTHLASLAATLDVLTDRARRRAKVTTDAETSERLEEVIEQLGEAAVQLRERRSREAAEWVALATSTLDDAVADADLAELEARAATLWTRLSEADRLPADLVEPPAAAPDAAEQLRESLAALEQAWTGALQAAKTELASLREEVSWTHGARDRALATDALGLADDALGSGDLRRALRASDQVRRLLDGASAAFDERLDAGLKQLRHRAKRTDCARVEQHGLEGQLARCRDRADVGLPTDDQRQALTALVAHLEGSEASPEMLALGVDGGLRPVCWWDTGVSVGAERHGAISADVTAGKLYLVRVAEQGMTWEKLPSRRERVLPVVSSDAPVGEVGAAPAHLQQWSGRLYVEGPEVVHGPYVARDGVLGPADERGLVASMDTADFWDLFGSVEIPSFEGRERHVVDPPSLHQMVTEGGRLHDELGEEGAEHWLHSVAAAVDGLSAESLEKAMTHLASMDLPEELLQSRLHRLRAVLGAARGLEQARKGAVDAWLASEPGAAAIDRAARAWVAEHRELVDAAVVAEKDRLARELAELDEERTASATRLERLRQEIDAVEQVRDDARFALLTAWNGETRRARRPTRSLGTEPLMRTASSLADEIDRAATAMGRDRDGLAVDLLTVLTQPIVIAAGPAGTEPLGRLAGVLRFFGHGHEAGRHLGLDVRHDWYDDVPVFGGWNPAEQRWEPGGEGVVEHLLHAARCWGAGRHGLHVVRLDGMQRQDPERYLGRVLHAMARREPIRLHAHASEADYPSQVPLPDNVRWLGSVVGDHDGRLSQDFLAGAAFVLSTPDVEALARDQHEAPVNAEPVSWRSLLACASTAEQTRHPALGEVIRALHRHGVSGAPGAVAVGAARRFLRASHGVLDAKVATDVAVLHHFLPAVRGVGSPAGEALGRVADRLKALGLRRSAERLRDICTVGESRGAFFDGASV